MKILTTALACIAASAPLLASPAAAQQGDSERYQERKRFPIVRKVFRQIRNDVRYHASALRETASGIGHDVKATIRGEGPPRGASQNRYGFRSVPQAQQPVYPPPQNWDYYEEPAPRRHPASPAPAQRGADGQPGASFEPERAQRGPGMAPPPATPSPPAPDDPLTEVPELEPLPSNDPRPPSGATASESPSGKTEQPEVASGQEQEAKSKPFVGKVEYPEAKRSNRPGFHYSPYAPYELLDTQGIEPGGLARDPGNGNIFRLPK